MNAVTSFAIFLMASEVPVKEKNEACFCEMKTVCFFILYKKIGQCPMFGFWFSCLLSLFLYLLLFMSPSALTFCKFFVGYVSCLSVKYFSYNH